MKAIKEEGRKEYKEEREVEGTEEGKREKRLRYSGEEWVWDCSTSWPPTLCGQHPALWLSQGPWEHLLPWGTGHWTPLQRGSRQDSPGCWFSRSPHKGRSHPENTGRRHCHSPAGVGNKTTGSQTWGLWSWGRWAVPPPGSAWCKPSPRTCNGLATTEKRKHSIRRAGIFRGNGGILGFTRNHPVGVMERKRMSYRWKKFGRGLMKGAPGR